MIGKIKLIIYSWIIVIFIFFLVLIIIRANENSKEELKYGYSYPAPYAITYTNGENDTIQVWRDKSNGDCIYMMSYSYKDGNYISYIPYFKYEKNPTKYKRIFNVMKYKKL